MHKKIPFGPAIKFTHMALEANDKFVLVSNVDKKDLDNIIVYFQKNTPEKYFFGSVLVVFIQTVYPDKITMLEKEFKDFTEKYFIPATKAEYLKENN